MQKLRCAIYTRKSSQEGLEQEFNSLHAQREACEAYVKSQAGEGWSALGAIYDDGGFSGGSMDRPALKALLSHIDRGMVDIVVVYKVDRLTRSLTDFARIVETFDRKGVSFVSVTQAFNTTTSMGRLTLNVLLSFAQFEREVTGERIRDKLAASKAKGMWMGGNLVLGYDVKDRALIINPEEAECVRHIFSRYLELGSVEALRLELDRDGVLSKAWVSSKGAARGGLPFSRGALFHLLKNELYVGQIRHKEKTHPGLHAGIVDPEVFKAVQTKLAAQAIVRRERPTRTAQALLKAILFDQDGVPMSPSFAYGKGGRRFSYYVSAPQTIGQRRTNDDAVRRVSAPALEALVLERLGRFMPEPSQALSQHLERVELGSEAIHLLLPLKSIPDHGDLAALRRRLTKTDLVTVEGRSVRIIIATRPVFRGGRTWLVAPDGQPAVERRRVDITSVKALRNAHALLTAHNAVPTSDVDHLRRASSPDDSYHRSIMRLAFLAPDIQQAIVEGRQPAGLTLERLRGSELPLAWADQRRALGF